MLDSALSSVNTGEVSSILLFLFYSNVVCQIGLSLSVLIIFVSFLPQSILLASIVHYSSAHYGSYLYPLWAHCVGWLISLVSIVWIPLGAIHEMYKNKGCFVQVSKTYLEKETLWLKYKMLQRVRVCEIISY